VTADRVDVVVDLHGAINVDDQDNVVVNLNEDNLQPFIV
jgi:hypothetical protein